jgi:tetratricopeptide (TPR) repeat protein
LLRAFSSIAATTTHSLLFMSLLTKKSLVAAAMNACLICKRPDDAMQLYDHLIGGDLLIADEWQWSGGKDSLDPLCRNLAIQALSLSNRPGVSDRAYELFKQAIENRDTLSMEAFIGLFVAFENEGRWKDAMALLFHVLETPLAELVSFDESEQASCQSKDPYLLGALESVMRCCNAEGQFGSAILALRVHQLALHIEHDATGLLHTESVIMRTVADSICCATDKNKLLTASMVSLAGLGLYTEALQLHDLVTMNSPTTLSDVNDDLVDLLKQQSSTQASEAWFHDIHRITAASHYSKMANTPFDNTPSFTIALGNAIHSCNMISQPEVGLQLIRWLQIPMLGRLGDEILLQQLPESDEHFKVSDRLLSSVMDSYTLIGHAEHAVALFGTVVKQDAQISSEWPMSAVAGIQALFSLHRRHEAMKLFDNAVNNSRSPDLFAVTAAGLLNKGCHTEVYDMYRLAMSCHCLSEDLTVSAMQAVSASGAEGSDRLLRNMVKEVSQLTGSDPSNWVKTRYWQLKRPISRSS